MNCNSAFCWNSSSKKQAVGTTWFYIVFRVYSISRDLMVSPAKAAVNKQGKFYWRNRIGACLLIEVMKSSDMAGVPSLFPKSPLIFALKKQCCNVWAGAALIRNFIERVTMKYPVTMASCCVSLFPPTVEDMTSFHSTSARIARADEMPRASLSLAKSICSWL